MSGAHRRPGFARRAITGILPHGAESSAESKTASALPIGAEGDLQQGTTFGSNLDLVLPDRGQTDKVLGEMPAQPDAHLSAAAMEAAEVAVDTSAESETGESDAQFSQEYPAGDGTPEGYVPVPLHWLAPPELRQPDGGQQ